MVWDTVQAVNIAWSIAAEKSADTFLDRIKDAEFRSRVVSKALVALEGDSVQLDKRTKKRLKRLMRDDRFLSSLITESSDSDHWFEAELLQGHDRPPAEEVRNALSVAFFAAAMADFSPAERVIVSKLDSIDTTTLSIINIGLDLWEQLTATSRESGHPANGPSSRIPDHERLPGWRSIDREFVLATVLSTPQLGRYFDGANPTWAHANSPAIPLLTVAENAWSSARDVINRRQSSCVLIIGPSGDGKSTALYQAAWRLLQHYPEDIEILWRPPLGEVSFDLELLASQPKARLFVSDDGHEIAKDVHQLLDRCEAEGRGDVFFLLASRDTDWRLARASAHGWGSRLVEVRVPNLDRPQATKLVAAWEQAGTDELRALARLKDTDARIERLLKLARPVGRSGPDSMFGAMLHARFDSQDLRAHLVRLLQRLDAVPVSGDSSLADAYLCVAALEAIGVPGIERATLSHAVGVSVSELGSRVSRILGDEAVAIPTGQVIVSRHVDIARAAIAVVETHLFDKDLAEIFSTVIRSAHHVAGHQGFNSQAAREWYRSATNAGRRVIENLPPGDFSFSRRCELGLAISRASVEERPQQLGYVVSLARTYRASNAVKFAAEVLDDAGRNLESFDDRKNAVRGFWYERAVCAGELGEDAANAGLAAYSISDSLDPAPLGMTQIKVSLAGMGVALRKLHQECHDQDLLKALIASAMLGMLAIGDDGRTGAFFASDLEYAKGHACGAPSSVSEAIAWLSAPFEEGPNRLGTSALPADVTGLGYKGLARALPTGLILAD